MKIVHSAMLLLALATSAWAQFDWGSYTSSSGSGSGSIIGSGGLSSSGSSSSSNSNNNNAIDGNNSGFSSASNGFDFGGFGSVSRYQTMLIAHAVLATVAFGFFFPVGGIMVRLGSFPGLWMVHAIFQVVATSMYIAALVLGIYLCRASGRGLYTHYHPIIGYVLMALLVFQPMCGMLHHTMFKKHNRRVFWSYMHIWLGRIIITLGIVNGGLGLLFATEYRILPPTQAAVIGYSVAAGVMWLFYLFAIIIGEGRRERRFERTTYKDEYESSRSRSDRGSRDRVVRVRSSRSQGRAKNSRYSRSEERRRYG